MENLKNFANFFKLNKTQMCLTHVGSTVSFLHSARGALAAWTFGDGVGSRSHDRSLIIAGPPGVNS